MTGLIRIGLTGGIATGKSTVARRWLAAGAAGVDTDELAHQTLTPDTPTWAAVVRRFGPDILKEDRTVDRSKLGAIVFADDAQRLALNAIVHPVVRRMWTRALAEYAGQGTHRIAVVSIPLLYEVNAEKEFDVIVVVGCREETQLARLAAKGLNESQARARIRAQWPLATKMDRADFVIWNDGSLAMLDRQADVVLLKIKENEYAPTKR